MPGVTSDLVSQGRGAEPLSLEILYLHHKLKEYLDAGHTQAEVYMRAGFSKGLLSNFKNHQMGMGTAATQDKLARGLRMNRETWRVDAKRWASGELDTRAAAEEPLDVAFPNLAKIILQAEQDAPLPASVAEKLRRVAQEIGDLPAGLWLSILESIRGETSPMRKTGPLHIVGGPKAKKR